MLISLLFVCITSDFLDLSHLSLKDNLIDPNKSIGSTQSINLNTQNKSLIRNYLIDNNKINTSFSYNRAKYVQSIYDKTCNNIFSYIISTGKFENKDSLLNYARKFLIEEIKNDSVRIKTSEYISILKSLDNNFTNERLLNITCNKNESNNINPNINYNKISSKSLTQYQNWVMDPYNNEIPEKFKVNNKLSLLNELEANNKLRLLEELEAYNDSYNYILSEYNTIQESIKTTLNERTPRSFNSSPNISESSKFQPLKDKVKV